MKYFILLSGILYSELSAAANKTHLLLQLQQKRESKNTIETFYTAVRKNDLKAIQEHLATGRFFPLNRLAKEATKYHHIDSLYILLEAGARPPLYEAAQQGRADLARLTLKHMKNLREPLNEREKKRILERLTKTGNVNLLNMYFNYGVLKPEDVSHDLVVSTRLGSKLYTTLIEKQFMHGSGMCAICRDNFTKEETHKPEFLLKCGHMFHTACSNRWFKKQPTCPLCKKLVRPKKIKGNN